MLGYFDTFPPEDLFSLHHRYVFTDLSMWVFLKRNQGRINLAEFLLDHSTDLIKMYKFGTILFLLNTTQVELDMFRFFEVFTVHVTDVDLLSELGVVYAEELMRYMIEYGLAEDYRPLDYRFIPAEWGIEISVFEYLIVNMPTLATYYIDTFEPGVVVDYLAITEGETYLHIAAREGNLSVYTKLSEREPVLTRIRNRQGQYADHILAQSFRGKFRHSSSDHSPIMSPREEIVT